MLTNRGVAERRKSILLLLYGLHAIIILFAQCLKVAIKYYVVSFTLAIYLTAAYELYVVHLNGINTPIQVILILTMNIGLPIWTSEPNDSWYVLMENIGGCMMWSVYYAGIVLIVSLIIYAKKAPEINYILVYSLVSILLLSTAILQFILRRIKIQNSIQNLIRSLTRRK
eukprot:129281_1